MPDPGWVLSLKTGSSPEAEQGIMAVYEVADLGLLLILGHF